MDSIFTVVISEQIKFLYFWQTFLLVILARVLFRLAVSYYKHHSYFGLFQLLVMEFCFFSSLGLAVAGIRQLWCSPSLVTLIEFLSYTLMTLYSLESYEKYSCPDKDLDR